jgi:serine/threonine protein phosphatase 1
MRTLVLGDVHGCNKALLQVLERSHFDFYNDTLISLGDICDGWPETPEVVDTLLKVRNLVAIRGNCDVWLHNYLKKQVAPDFWKKNMGRATIKAYQRSGKLKDPRHLALFNKQIPYHVDEKNRLYVHAGYDPSRKINKQKAIDLCQSRALWFGLLEAQAFGDPFPTDVNTFTDVFIGHTQTIKHFPHERPVRIHRTWNLDQGVKSGGRLTLMDAETKEFWQSDPANTLYTAEEL